MRCPVRRREQYDLPGVRELNAVVERHVGPIVDSRHSFGDADALRRALEEAGFTGVRVDTFTHDVQFADGALFARLNAMAAIGMSAKGKDMDEKARAELAGRIAAESAGVISAASTTTAAPRARSRSTRGACSPRAPRWSRPTRSWCSARRPATSSARPTRDC